VELTRKLQDVLDGRRKLYYRLGVNADLDDTIIRQIARMRSLNRKNPFHPPQTIVDPATIVHEMRVLKSAEEIELMQRAAESRQSTLRGDESSAAGHERI